MSKARSTVFAPLVSEARARAVALVRDERTSLDDGLYLLRALDDLEADGVELFGAAALADVDFYRSIESYLGARVGLPLTLKLGLDSTRL